MPEAVRAAVRVRAEIERVQRLSGDAGHLSDRR
jgi:hypothetical protein